MKNWSCHKSIGKRSQISDFSIKSLILILIQCGPNIETIYRIWLTLDLQNLLPVLFNLLISAYNIFYILISINFRPYLPGQPLAITNFFNFFIHTVLVYVFETLLMVPALPRNLNQHLDNSIHPIKTKCIFYIHRKLPKVLKLEQVFSSVSYVTLFSLLVQNYNMIFNVCLPEYLSHGMVSSLKIRISF